MNIRFLPAAVRTAAEEAGGSGPIRVALRCGQAFNGRSGEAFLLRFDHALILVERQLGALQYETRRTTPGALKLRSSQRRGLNLELEFELEGESLLATCPRSEEEVLAPLLEAPPAPETAAPATPEADAPTPGVLLTAALMFAAGADAGLTAEEEALVRRLSVPGELAAGVAFYQQHTLEELAAAARSRLTPELCLALLVGMLEVAFADGKFSSSEQTLLRDFAEALNVPADRYRLIRDTLLQRAQLPALFAAADSSHS